MSDEGALTPEDGRRVVDVDKEEIESLPQVEKAGMGASADDLTCDVPHMLNANKIKVPGSGDVKEKQLEVHYYRGAGAHGPGRARPGGQHRSRGLRWVLCMKDHVAKHYEQPYKVTGLYHEAEPRFTRKSDKWQQDQAESLQSVKLRFCNSMESQDATPSIVTGVAKAIVYSRRPTTSCRSAARQPVSPSHRVRYGT